MRTAFVNNSPSTTESVERVTTPVDMNILEMEGPLDPAFTRPSLQRIEDLDLDTQPMKGPRETGNVTTDLLDQYIDENYADVLRTSLLNPSSYLLLPSVKTSPHQTQQRLMAMDWYGLATDRIVESSKFRKRKLLTSIHQEEEQVR